MIYRRKAALRARKFAVIWHCCVYIYRLSALLQRLNFNAVVAGVCVAEGCPCSRDFCLELLVGGGGGGDVGIDLSGLAKDLISPLPILLDAAGMRNRAEAYSVGCNLFLNLRG